MTLKPFGILAMTLALFGCSPNYPDPPVDPLSIERSKTDNDILYCPAGDTSCISAEIESAVFDIDAGLLFEHWLGIIEAEPRTTIIASDPERLLIHAEQRSAIFRFVDTILIRAVAIQQGAEAEASEQEIAGLEEDKPETTASSSSYIALSRSEMGSSDLGVNAERMIDWSQKLSAKIR